MDTPSAPAIAETDPPEVPYQYVTSVIIPSSINRIKAPNCPIVRTPPPLNDIHRGRQRKYISPAVAREMSYYPHPQISTQPASKDTSLQTPPHLTPSALFSEQAKLDSMRLKVYNRILSNVHKKIRVTSGLPGSPQMTNYDVPEWQPGCPCFDVKDCILYMVWNLRNSGFRVMYISPNRILVSWKEHSAQYYQEESPIRQAMVAATHQNTVVPAAPPVQKKASGYKPTTEGIAAMLSQQSASGRRGAGTITFI